MTATCTASSIVEKKCGTLVPIPLASVIVVVFVVIVASFDTLPPPKTSNATAPKTPSGTHTPAAMRVHCSLLLDDDAVLATLCDDDGGGVANTRISEDSIFRELRLLLALLLYRDCAPLCPCTCFPAPPPPSLEHDACTLLASDNDEHRDDDVEDVDGDTDPPPLDEAY